MNAQELQAKVEELVAKGYVLFALQDKEGQPLLKNCVREVYPVQNRYNTDQVLQNLVPYVNKFPGFYWLKYRRTNLTPYEVLEIDTRTEEEKTSEPQKTEMPTTMIDERDKTERRNDELYIRQLERENARLSEENKALSREIVRLEEEAEALAAEADENQQATMADQTVSMVGQVAQILPAVLDKWFSLQEQKNALMAEQLRRSQPRPQQPQPNVNNMYHEEAGY